MLPTTTAQWVLERQGGFEDLKFHPSVPIPKLGDHDCLVKIEAVSLNYRDLVVAKGQYPLRTNIPLIPCSDGAGSILAVGPRVTAFSVGDKVTTIISAVHQFGAFDDSVTDSALGGMLDGTLRQYAVFEDVGLVRMPKNLSFEEACTLCGSGVTAWNALFCAGKPLQPGSVILTQGTGGTSIAAAQFALAVGAKVIATTSSEAKAERLRALGVQHVINYRDDPNWGETARKFTRNGEGVDHVIDVGGAGTLGQSLKAVRYEGTISIIGFLSGVDQGPSMLEVLYKATNARGILGGNKKHHLEMVNAVEASDIKPAIDDKIFRLEEAKEAFQHLWDQKHFSKIVIKID